MPMMWAGCSDDDAVDNGGNGGNGGSGGEVINPNAPIVIENEGNITIPVEGGEQVLNFTAVADWEIVPDQSWCRVSPRYGAAGKQQVTFNVAANNSYDERNSMVTLRLKDRSFEKKFTVTQKQKNALTLTSNKVEVTSRGGEIMIELKSNVEVTAEIEAAAQGWIKANGTRAMEVKNFVFTISENGAFSKRQGKITFKTEAGLEEVVTVYQDGAKEEVILSQSQFSLDYNAQEIKVEVRSNVEHTMKMPSNAPWLSEVKSRGYSSSTYVFRVEENTTPDMRSAEITFEYKAQGKAAKEILTIMQKSEGGMAQSLTIVHNNSEFMAPSLFGEAVVAKILWGDNTAPEEYKAGAKHSYSNTQNHAVIIESENAEGFKMNNIKGLIELNVVAF